MINLQMPFPSHTIINISREEHSHNVGIVMLRPPLSIRPRPLLSAGAHVLLETSQKTLKTNLTFVALPAAKFLKLKGSAVERPLHYKF